MFGNLGEMAKLMQKAKRKLTPLHPLLKRQVQKFQKFPLTFLKQPTPLGKFL